MTETPSIVVVGSLNVDIVVPVPHLPAPGETIAGDRHLKTLGGKGANQAVAAARLGNSVAMVGRLGADAEGEACLDGLREAGADTTHVARDAEVATGIAMIAVDPSGENTIVVGPGSNARLSVDDVSRAEPLLKNAAVTVVQLEIPMETVEEAARLAGGTFILNPAPAKRVPPEVLERVDILTPNEVELAMLSGMEVQTKEDVVSAARSLDGPRAVAVTLGKRGVVLVTADEVLHVPALEVEVVDTTAAGDAFCGALADAVARGSDVVDAVRWGVTAACLSVTKMGAQPSLPTRAEVMQKARVSGTGAG